MAPSRAAGAPPSTFGRFFGCYLVGSRNPAMRGRTYVGFTVDPPRRIRQHNGVLASGAKYTRRLRPCSMLLVVYGFPSKVQALQFEWAWQKPRLSRAVRETAVALGVSDKSSSVINKTKLVMAMCALSPWKHLPLTVHFFDDDAHRVALEQCARAPLPEQMEITKGDMEALKRNAGAFGGRDGDDVDDDADDDDADASDVSLSDSDAVSVSAVSEVTAVSGKNARDKNADATSRRAFQCGVCGEGHAKDTLVPISLENKTERRLKRPKRNAGCPRCDFRAHPSCLAGAFFRQASEAAAAAGAPPPPDRALVPSRGRCPACREAMSWGSALAAGRRKAAETVPGDIASRSAARSRENLDASRLQTAPFISKRPATTLGAGFYDDLEDDESDDDSVSRDTQRIRCADGHVTTRERNKENAAPERKRDDARESSDALFSDSDAADSADAADAAPLRDRLAKRAAGARRNDATPKRAHVSISP